MMTGIPVPEASLKNQKPLQSIFWNGGPPINTETGVNGVKSPEDSNAVKTITLTNFSGRFIYPFLRTANIGKAAGKFYDPQDFHNHEFREYVGYTTTERGGETAYWLGMPPGATITFQVPLVLWDGGHFTLTTDGTDLTDTTPPVGTLFGYSNSAQIAFAQTDPVADSTWVTGSANYRPAFHPMVMFYYAKTPAAVGDDAPAQLVEFTFRDPLLKQLGVTDTSQTFPLLSYDVSYVNTLHAPAALEASKVPITTGSLATKPKSNLVYYPPHDDWGWNGSNQNMESFLPRVKAFVNNTRGTTAFIGDYFGGHGWPRYFNPIKDSIVIPSGANLFENSPLDARTPPDPNGVHTSRYSTNEWLLSSAGQGPIKVSGTAGPVSTPRPKELTFTFIDLEQKLKFGATIEKMLLAARDFKQTIAVTASNAKFKAAIVGSLDSYKPGPGLTGKATVTLNKDVPKGDPMSIDFSRTATDYAATAITNLWYSWARYYTDTLAEKFKNYSQTATGTLNTSGKKGNAGPFVTNQVTFASLPPNLSVGMTVSGNGVWRGTSVLRIEKNPNNTYTVFLSRIQTNGEVGKPLTQQYTFRLPTPLPISPKDAQYTKPYTLDFDPSKFPKNIYTPNPLAFAGSVYQTMLMATTAPETSPYLPKTMDVVNNVIGFNVHFDTGKQTGWNTEVVAQVRDIVKSILRGVVDFLATPDQNDWYPDPASKVPGTSIVENKVRKQAPFNVFNLDPYVWFVHKVQGLSGYGFSVDDDVSNPIATGPTDPNGNKYNLPNNLQVGFAGIRGEDALRNARPLGNQREWFPTLKFGTIETLATVGYVTVKRNNKDVQVPVITLQPTAKNPNPLRVLNQFTVPGDGQIGPTVTAPQNPGIFKPGTTAIFFPNGVDVKDFPNIELNQSPLKVSTKPIWIKISAAQ